MENQDNSPTLKQGKVSEKNKIETLKPVFDSLQKQETFKDHFDNLKTKSLKHRRTQGLLTLQPANDWIAEAKSRPIPKMLFDKFWYETELCILFADTNLGKSILAVQIADSISKGEPIDCFKMEAQKQSVVIVDFELSAKQFENRYSIEYSNHYIFDDKLQRSEINPDADFPKNETYEEYLNRSLEKCIRESDASILIIDNITYLKNGTEKARDALPLMKHLKALKTKFGLSILALAHTPKRDISKPLTRNDLQGSKMLINFCDSCFAIGESHSDKHLRYLKQIKARNTEIVYDTENVAVCQITKPSNFLKFEFITIGSEREHLRELSSDDKAYHIERAKQLSRDGLSQRKIASELNISLGAVNKYINK